MTGFLGKVVLADLLDREGEGAVDTIFVLVRPGGGKSAQQRFEAKVARSKAFAGRGPELARRVRVLSGDLSRPRCGLDDEAYLAATGAVTEIIHCAASVEFDMPLAEACEANTTTALEVLELARRSPALRVMVSVSTAYVLPHREGAIHEEIHEVFPDPEATYAGIRAGSITEAELLRRSGHPNTYALTKCLAEQLLARRRGDVPLRIVRPSIISACASRPMPGWIDSKAALAAFVVLIGAGHMRAIAADPEAVVDIVPCDHVAARAIDEAFAGPPAGGLRVTHVVAGLGNAITCAEITGAIVRDFAAQPVLRRPRVTYLGPRNLRYALHRWVQHVLASRLMLLWCTLVGDRRRKRTLLRGPATLDRVTALFHYFSHRTFDFRTSAPLEASFDVRRYFDVVCSGTRAHLMPAPRVPAGARPPRTERARTVTEP